MPFWAAALRQPELGGGGGGGGGFSQLGLGSSLRSSDMCVDVRCRGTPRIEILVAPRRR